MNFAAGQKRERRLYENTALVAVREERVIGLLWTRRGRKSTTLGNMAFDELSAGPGRTVIGASASLLLGTELVSMTVTATAYAVSKPPLKMFAPTTRNVYAPQPAVKIHLKSRSGGSSDLFRIQMKQPRMRTNDMPSRMIAMT